MVEAVVWVFLAGFLGGVIRGLVGIAKEMRSSPTKKKHIRIDYILVTILAAGGLGILVGVYIVDDVRFALLAGYAGTDFLESVYKIKMKKRTFD